MITLCATYSGNDNSNRAMVQSAHDYVDHLSETVLIRNDAGPHVCPYAAYRHAWGLWQAYLHSKNEWILFADLDVLFFRKFSIEWLDLYQSKDIKIFGLQHHMGCPYGLFPSVTMMLIHRSAIPTRDFLNNIAWNSPVYRSGKPIGCHHRTFSEVDIQIQKDLLLRGNFLTQGCPGYHEEYLPTNKIYDVGNLLYLYAKRNNIQWLSSLCPDIKTRNSDYIYYLDSYATSTELVTKTSRPFCYHRRRGRHYSNLDLDYLLYQEYESLKTNHGQ